MRDATGLHAKCCCGRSVIINVTGKIRKHRALDGTRCPISGRHMDTLIHRPARTP